MRPTKHGLVGLMMVAVALWPVTVGAVLPTKAQKCEAAKVTAAGTKQKCLATERAKEVKGQTFNDAKCDVAFLKAFENAEDDAGAGVCPSENDAVAVEALIDACFDDLKAALSGSPNPPCVPGKQLLATGQTTCWDSGGTVIPSCAGTGQDGEIRAGTALSYRDNGDGTITDIKTGLMWEKKSNDDTIHDKDKTYGWAAAFTEHVAELNTTSFAGHTDWRLPNVRELQSLVDVTRHSPAVSPAFNTACPAGCTVLTCSCSAPVLNNSGITWTSTSFQKLGEVGSSWGVGFQIYGFTILEGKRNAQFVRAVRGGL